MSASAKCTECGSSDIHFYECQTCEGEGSVQRAEFGSLTDYPCQDCNGNGLMARVNPIFHISFDAECQDCGAEYAADELEQVAA